MQSAEALANLNSYPKKMAVVSFPVFNYACAWAMASLTGQSALSPLSRFCITCFLDMVSTAGVKRSSCFIMNFVLPQTSSIAN